MAKEKSEIGKQSLTGAGCLGIHNRDGLVPEQATRKLEVHEASFAIEYLRVACHGMIPNSLRQRVGESDLIQDALLKVTQSVGQYRGTTLESFRSWLREIYRNRLRNLVRDHIASQQRSVRREEAWGADAAVDKASCSSQFIQDETTAVELQIMNETFQQLTAKDQQVVELRSRRGLAFEQIATMLGVSEVSVRKRYARAITRWRKLVQQASKHRS